MFKNKVIDKIPILKDITQKSEYTNGIEPNVNNYITVKVD